MSIANFMRTEKSKLSEATTVEAHTIQEYIKFRIYQMQMARSRQVDCSLFEFQDPAV
jgi:hypothetical protein